MRRLLSGITHHEYRMSRRWITFLPLSAAAGLLAACSDSTGPVTGRLTSLALDFCAADAPVFFAYMNDGASWTALSADASHTYRFQATPKVAIAFVHQTPSTSATEVIYATSDELAPLSGIACTEASGAKTLNGNVAGVSAGADAWITMGDQTAQVFPPPDNFTLANLPDGPLDLVANRDAFTVSNTVPDRVIVRRGLNLTNGSTIPTLDFSAAEALAPATNSLSVTGLAANEDNFINLTFSTPTVRDHSLYYAARFTTTPQVIYHVPASLTQPGDFHTLDVYGQAGSNYHGVLQFYRLAADRAAAFGPLLAAPAFTKVGTSPVRLRMTLPVQPQYASFANAFYSQQGTLGRTVSVTGTSGYFSSPSTWTLDMPDLSGLAGYPSSASLESGISTTSSAQAYGGSAALFFGGAPAEGATLKYAGTTSSVATSRASSVRAPFRHEMRYPFPGLRWER